MVTNPSRSRTALQGDTPFSPHQIEDGVYTASSYSEDGEKIYLRMERITEENNRAWRQYIDSAHRLIWETSGALVALPRCIEKNEGRNNYLIDLRATPTDSLLQMTGFNQEEYSDFLDYLIKQGCVKSSLKLKTLNACRAGMVANVMTKNHESYAIYASKNPDFSIKNIPLSHTGAVNLNDFIHHYDDLIMSVGSDFSSSDDYENRGIFRNPLSIIDNKHKGISMILHGFTAAVAQKFFPEKKYMRVRPIGSMQAISSASELIDSNPSKKSALNEVSRAIRAQNFCKGEYVVYALKHGAESTLPITARNSNNIKNFEQDYGNILMSFHSEWVPKETITGFILNEQSYQNRGIFRNPVSIIENKHKGLAMLLHGFSASVAQIFFPEKKFLQVSPIGSMQYILFHSLPREAFANTDEDYARIKSVATTMSGSEVVDNYIKTQELFNLYLETSTKNQLRTKLQTSENTKSTPQEITCSYRQSVKQDRNTLENDGLSVMNDPQQMARGVFTGIGTAASGETVYLKMELITEENQADWKEYIRRSSAITGIGTLGYLANNTHQTTGDGHTYYVFKDKDDRTFLPHAGFNAEEFNDFINYLGQQGFVAESKKTEILNANAHGSRYIKIHLGNYIIYATKTPDFDIKKNPISQKEIKQDMHSAKDFIARYEGILMTVGSNFNYPNDSYYTRGISRNPYNVIENTYKGISMLLHGFTAAVAQKFFSEKKEMKVEPIGSMAYLLLTTLKPEDVTITGMSFDEAKEKCKSDEELPLHTIKVDSLAKIYYESYKPDLDLDTKRQQTIR